MIWVTFQDGGSGWFLKYEHFDGSNYVYRKVGKQTSRVFVEYKKIGEAFFWVEIEPKRET